MATDPARTSSRERIEQIVREVGTLLIAFAPLDSVLASDRSDTLLSGLIFLTIGVSFVAGALVAERRR